MGNTKLIIMSTYEDNPHFSDIKMYYINWSTDAKILKKTVDEAVGIISMWSITENWEAECKPEDVEMFKSIKNQTELDRKFFESLHYFDGGKGYDTEIYGEGEEIGRLALGFYNDEFRELDEECAYDDEDEDAQECLDLAEALEEDIENEELVVEFLNMLCNKIDDNNSNMW